MFGPQHYPASTSFASASSSWSPASSSSALESPTPFRTPARDRRAQYKSASRTPHRAANTQSSSGFTSPTPVASSTEPPTRARMKLSALERAAKARARAVNRTREASGGMDVDEEREEQEEEDPLFEELFDRFMHHHTNTIQHDLLVASMSARHFGAIDEEGVEDWEAELAEGQDALEIPPESDGEDLEALAAFADFADLPPEELFAAESWSGDEEDAMQIE
ncbi:Carboxypeptidase [Mycena kentingensis (nom. inval.)]|nr:Carboxypeptidase [Mycena kentingensis (nom. inval.)]